MKNTRTFKKFYLTEKNSPDEVKNNLHEVYTAILTVIPPENILSLPSTIKEDDKAILDLCSLMGSTEILDKVPNIDKSKIKQLQDDLSNGNYQKNSLAQAISSAKSIFENTTIDIITSAYLVGNSWADIPKYLQRFSLTYLGMKDFNSSDIICVGNSKDNPAPQVLGVSLKRKETTKAVDPTIINKSLMSLIEELAPKIKGGTDTLNKLNDAIDNFYVSTLNDMSKDIITIFKKDKSISELDADNIADLFPVTEENWKKSLNKIFNIKSKSTPRPKDLIRKIINSKLSTTSGKSLFVDIQDIMSKSKKLSKLLAKSLLALITKEPLKTYDDFMFTLCVGIGKYYKSSKSIKIEKASYHPLESVLTAISQLQHNPDDELDIIVDKKKTKFPTNITNNDEDIQAPAKLFFNIVLDNDHDSVLANIEVRYKGNYTSSPQFFAQFSPDLTSILEKLSSSESK